MASLDGLRTRYYNAKGVVQEVRDDGPIGLRLRYIGNGAVTSVVVTTATNIVTTTTGTNEGAKTYTFATYTTLGALAAKINGDGIFEAKVVDALLSDLTTNSNFKENTTIVAGTDDNGVVCYDLHIDCNVAQNSSVYAMTVLLGTSRNFNVPDKLRLGHRVKLQEISYYVDLGTAAANSVRVYQRNGQIETQLFGHLSVDATITSITFASGQGTITSADGAELLVRVQATDSLTDSASNYVRAVGILE